MIDLDYKTNTELFNKDAKEWATKIGKDVKNTQIRKFYDAVLDLSQEAKNISNDEVKSDILPFVKMLNSKVAYASTRKSGGSNLINQAFVSMMQDCINQIDSKQKLESFKLFFEAVIGFHKSIEGEK
ncbi:MAG: type III-A CRISPR-associated protein Csm2 [Sulfurovum sp.]|nr:type III-A CRISPR-associated protein Csm2 [Sulfurovum sp.]